VCAFDAGLYVSALQNNTIKRSLTSSAWYSQDMEKEREQYCQLWPAPVCHCTNTAKRLKGWFIILDIGPHFHCYLSVETVLKIFIQSFQLR